MAYGKITAAAVTVLLLATQALSQIRPAPPPNQGDSKDAAALFDAAASKHKRELRGLLRTRGMPEVHLRDVTAASVARVLSVRSGKYGVEAGYPANTGVLFYSYEGGRLGAWLIGERGVWAHAEEEVSQALLSTAVSNLKLSLGVESTEGGQTSKTRGVTERIKKNSRARIDEALSVLTGILFPPTIAAVLSSVEHLVVVPVSDLGTVPFAALKPFGPEAYLIDRMSISVAPNLFDVGQSIERWSPEFNSPLVVGNPHLPPGEALDPLPWAEVEAKEVAKIVGAAPLLGRQATKQAVLSRAPEADLLYFAAHGVASSDDPLSGGYLVLSAEQHEKGHLTAREVQGMGLRLAKLAVLSGCQTGLGKTHEAGVIGLARAFQLAGVPRVVMSLWKVEDESTNELMQAFVRKMKNNVPSAALRLAILEVRKNRPEISQWAPFVLFGTPR